MIYIIFQSVIFIFWIVLLPDMTWAASTRTQTIELKAGWNAVFLEVEPLTPKPDTVFADMPVLQALTYYPKNSSVEFIVDPKEISWNKAGWHGWVPKDKSEAVLNNLYSLQAGQAYLLRCATDYTWKLTGEVKFKQKKWQPNAYNLTGFYVDPASPPTFERYFKGTRSAEQIRIFALKNDNWAETSLKELIHANQAYWVWYQGEADYPGPLGIKLQAGGDELTFLSSIKQAQITVTNRSSEPFGWRMEQASESAIPLFVEKTDKEMKTRFENLTQLVSETPLSSSNQQVIRLASGNNATSSDVMRGVLMISGDMGVRFHIPVAVKN
ncbi:MAG: hypothetical protein H7839_02630 [Magnetococcus sp. YQC-5]